MWGRTETSTVCRVALATALLSCGCFVEMSVPEGTVINCETSAQCPGDMVCRVTIGRCVQADKKDDTAPNFVGVPALNRTSGRQGSLFVLTFEVNESQFELPAVYLDLDGPRLFTPGRSPNSDEGPLEYSFDYTAVGDEPETSAISVMVDLMDGLGNAATRNAGVITLDFTAPPLVGLDWDLESGKTAAKQDDVLTYGATSEVGVAVVGARLLDADGNALLPDILLELTVVNTEVQSVIEGAVDLSAVTLTGASTIQVELAVEDQVGNSIQLVEARTPSLPVDLQPPTGTAVVINDGDTATVAVLVNVHLDAIDAHEVWISVTSDVSEGTNTGKWIAPAGGFPATLAVTLTSAAGPKTVSAIFRDAAHHEVLAEDQIALEVDVLPPIVSTFNVVPNDYTNTRVVSVTLEATDNFGDVAYFLITTSSTEPASGDFVLTSPPTQFTLPDVDGQYTLVAWVRDDAGIVGFAVGPTVFLDRVIPEVTGFTIDVADPTAEPELPITVTSMDPGEGTTGSGIWKWLITRSATSPSPGDFLRTSPPAVFPESGEGPVSLFPWVTDRAGNVSAASAPAAIFVDTIPPVVDSFVVPAFAAVDPLTVTVAGSDPGYPATGTGISGWLITEVATPPAPSSFDSAAPTLYTLGADGFYELYSWAIDVTDNVSAPVRQTTIRGEFRVNATTAGSQTAPDVATNDSGTTVIVWSNVMDSSIRARILYPAAAASVELEVTDSADSGPHSAPAVGINADGEALVVWQRGSFGDRDIMGQRLTATGTRLGTSFLVNSSSADDHFNADVAVNDAGAAVVVWQMDPGGTAKEGVLHRRFDATGAAQGDQARSDTSGWFSDARYPAVAISDGGSYVVVWLKGTSAITGRLYAADGSGPAVERDLGTGTSYALPDVGMDATGAFVVCWTNDTGTDPTDVVAQRFDASGDALGTTVRVHGTSAGNQKACKVARHRLGPYVIAWEGNGDQTDQVDDSGIFARRYSAAGASLGEVRVNIQTSGEQSTLALAFEAAATLADDRAVVVWQSSDGDATDIYGRQY